MHKLVIPAIAALISGCAAHYQAHQGPALPDGEAALIYDTRAFLSIFSIDGKKTDYAMGKIVELTEGEHDIVLYFKNTPRPVLLSPLFMPGKYQDGMFNFRVNLRKGYSYTIAPKMKPGESAFGKIDEACIYGEPHNAAGSKTFDVNRKNSPTVEAIACIKV